MTARAIAVSTAIALSLAVCTVVSAQAPEPEGTCSDAASLEEERRFLTGGSDSTADSLFWTPEARRGGLEEWARRVESVRARGLSLDDARALGTLLYGTPQWLLRLGEIETAETVCSSLRPLVVAGFERPLSAPDRRRSRPREDGVPSYVVTVRGDDGTPTTWSRAQGLRGLIAEGSPLDRLSPPEGFVDDEAWSAWRERLGLEIDRSDCLGGDVDVRELLLDALEQAARRETLALDLQELREPLGRSATPLAGPAPGLAGIEARSLLQGDAQILGVRVRFERPRPSDVSPSPPAPRLVRFHVFDESRSLATAASARVEPAPGGGLADLAHWLGSAPAGRHCVVARIYDLASGRAGDAAAAWSTAGSVEDAELSLEAEWSDAGSVIDASAGAVRSDVWAVGFRVDGGEWVWSRGPAFRATLSVEPARLDVTVEAVAVSEEREVLASASRRIDALPKTARVRLRRLTLEGLGGDGLGVAVEVEAGRGRPVEAVDLVIDGGVVETRLEPPYLFSLARERSRPGTVIEARARFEGGGSLDGALVLGAPGVLSDEVEVRLLELPFQLRRGGGGLDRPLASEDVVVRVGEEELVVDRLLYEDSLALRTLLLVDVSGTMLEEQAALAMALDRFARSLKPTDEVGLVEFRQQARVVLPISARKERLVEAVHQLTVGGGTAVYDAIATAVTALPAGVGRRAVVLLSDGLDEHSRLGEDDVAALLARGRVALYVAHVVTGDLVGDTGSGSGPLRERTRHLNQIRGRLGDLARGSGGAYCYAPSQKAIGGCLDEFADDLRRTYLAVVRLDEGEDGEGARLSLRPGVRARLEKR